MDKQLMLTSENFLKRKKELTTYNQTEDLIKYILITGDASAEKKASLFGIEEKDKFTLSIKYIEQINSALLSNELSKTAYQALSHIFYSFCVYGDASAEEYKYILSAGCYHSTRSIALNLQLPLDILLDSSLFVLNQDSEKYAAGTYQEVIDDTRQQSIKDRKEELVEYAYKQIRKMGLPSTEGITSEMALKICNYEMPDHIG